MNEDLKVILCISFFGAALISLVVILGFVLNNASCKAHWKDSVYEYKFGAISGCMVKTNKGWVPSKNVMEF